MIIFFSRVSYVGATSQDLVRSIMKLGEQPEQSDGTSTSANRNSVHSNKKKEPVTEADRISQEKALIQEVDKVIGSASSENVYNSKKTKGKGRWITPDTKTDKYELKDEIELPSKPSHETHTAASY